MTELGADLVIDHSQPLSEELKRAGIDHVTHVASLTQTDHHLDQLVEALEPQGKLALIDDPKSLDVSKLTPAQYVCEVIMEPKITPLLQAALDKGCPVQYGAPMLACQIQLMAQMLGVEVES